MKEIIFSSYQMNITSYQMKITIYCNSDILQNSYTEAYFALPETESSAKTQTSLTESHPSLSLMFHCEECLIRL